jgi:hypothetical protein
MRMFAIAVLLIGLVQGASAQDKLKNDPTAEPNAEKSAESEVLMMVDQFTKSLEDAGFKEVTVAPQFVLVQAKDKFDRPVVMILNTETMVAAQLKIQPESETTGNGSTNENEFRWQERK